jgi:hypothetical protein
MRSATEPGLKPAIIETPAAHHAIISAAAQNPVVGED